MNECDIFDGLLNHDPDCMGLSEAVQVGEQADVQRLPGEGRLHRFN